MNSHIIKNLYITSTKEEYDVKLPPLFALNRIPTSKENIIQQEHLYNWPHLDSIHIPKVDSDIELLIGTNLPQATEPFEIIHAPDGNEGPYATKTRLGWLISGLTL